MATIINPKIVTPPQPINLDAYILQMQQRLAELTWLEKVFGRAWKMYQSRGGMGSSEGLGRGYAYPGVYGGMPKNEYFNALPNDTFKAYCFFSPRDSAQPATSMGNDAGSYEPGTWNEWRQPLSIIFWFNSKKINAGNNYPLTENLLADVRKLLRTIAFFELTDVYYDPENIFEGYSLDYVKEQYLDHPFGGFRIAGMIQFLENDVFGACDPFPVNP